MTLVIDHPIDSREKLREVLPAWEGNASKKDADHITEVGRAFIARSPYVVISTVGADARLDLSPKGDAPGFVTVHDDKTLIIPDRLGNHRLDTFENLLVNPQVGLFFVIPGHRETLRVAGTGVIAADPALREPFAVKGRVPDLVLVVTVTQAFMHCSKSLLRSHLWAPDTWEGAKDAPTLAQWVKETVETPETLDEVQARHDRDRETRLY